ncbi:hypothetical protein MNEG_15982, partial [Monoraphidium neglectum]
PRRLARAAPDGDAGLEAPPTKPPAPQPGPRPAKPERGSAGGGPEEPPPQPELPPQLRRLVALLVEYGGVYGTAACLFGFFLKIDPFGGFHWEPQDALLGVKLFAPLLVFDAL